MLGALGKRVVLWIHRHHSLVKTEKTSSIEKRKYIYFQGFVYSPTRIYPGFSEDFVAETWLNPSLEPNKKKRVL